MIPYDDRGLLLGDGLFETLLVKNGSPIFLQDHWRRMADGCAVLGLDAPSFSAFYEACQTALAGAGLEQGRAAVRVTLTAGSGGRGLDRPQPPGRRLFATAAPAPEPNHPVELVTVNIRRNEGSPTSRLKTLAYADNVLARQAAGAAEALMLNNLGEVACAAVANVFWIVEGRLFTPATDCGVLPGVMRTALFTLARANRIEVQEVRAVRSELDEVEGLFLTNCLTGVRPVIRLDDRRLEPHPLALELAAALAQVS